HGLLFIVRNFSCIDTLFFSLQQFFQPHYCMWSAFTILFHTHCFALPSLGFIYYYLLLNIIFCLPSILNTILWVNECEILLFLLPLRSKVLPIDLVRFLMVNCKNFQCCTDLFFIC